MYDLYLFTLWNSIKIGVFVYHWSLSYSGSDVIDNGPVSPALSERQVCFCSALHKQVNICFIRLSFEFVLTIKML